jgi:hypothetical protein
MSSLTDLIRERRRRQEGSYRTLAIFHMFIDPTIKNEATDLPRLAVVISGHRLWQEPNESDEEFEARVMVVAKRLRGESEQVN